MINSCFQLIKSFVLVGLGAYGGGLVTIPLIQHEIVAVQGWLSLNELASLLAIAQMTPGPIAINAATFVGFRIASFSGALVATLAVVLPSVSLMALVTPFIDRIKHNQHVKKVQEGFKIGVLSLIIFASWSYGSVVLLNVYDLLLAFAAFVALVKFEGKLHPVVITLACGLLSLIFL
ncbi:MAG: Chromate transport protein [Candidatus Rifleibacterium amylolyticum]|nr:MAG: Chromate transport protein [Candidatus Rifleibacterium amylolyticum]